jgi:hypothetical protein
MATKKPNYCTSLLSKFKYLILIYMYDVIYAAAIALCNINKYTLQLKINHNENICELNRGKREISNPLVVV